MGSFINKEDGRDSRNLAGNDIVGSILRYALSPFRHRARHDLLVGTCDVGCKADARLWPQGRKQGLHHLAIAIWRLDEKLRLVFGIHARL